VTIELRRGARGRGSVPPAESDDERAGGLGPWIGGSPALVFITTFIYAAAGNFKHGPTFGSVFAVGAITAAATLMVGGMLGFLFGLPRTLERVEAGAILATNGSLDQISDWLTKILVGLGLVQIGKLAHGIGRLSSDIAPALGAGMGGRTLATCILVYSLANGFLIGYLGTRILLSPLLKAAAENLRGRELRTLAAFADSVLATPPPAPPPAPPPPLSTLAASVLATPPPAPPPAPPSASVQPSSTPMPTATASVEYGAGEAGTHDAGGAGSGG
jgi:hypothetical protein